MDIQLHSISPVEARLRVTIPAKVYQPGVQKRVKNHAQKARIPGFRQGYVPHGHILRVYGQSLLLEEINELLQHALTDYVKEKQLKTLGEPLLEEADPLGKPSDEKDYHFSYQIGLQGDISLENIEKTSFTRYVIEPEEQDLHEFVENLQQRFGTTTHPERVEEVDVLLSGHVQVAEARKEALILPRAQMLPKEQARFAGMAINDSLQVQPAALYAPKAVPAALLRLQKQGVDLAATYLFVLERIDLIQNASVDEKLFANMYGAGKVTDKADFMQRNNQYLKAQYTVQSRRFLHNQMKQVLIKDFSPPLPEGYLKKRFDSNTPKDQPVDEAILAASFIRYKDELRWRMLQVYVAEKNRLAVQPEELKSEIERLLLQQMQVHGEPSEKQRQDVQPFVQKFLSQKANTESIYEQMQEERVLTYLEEQVNLQDKTVTPTAFHALAQKQVGT